MYLILDLKALCKFIEWTKIGSTGQIAYLHSGSQGFAEILLDGNHSLDFYFF